MGRRLRLKSRRRATVRRIRIFKSKQLNIYLVVKVIDIFSGSKLDVFILEEEKPNRTREIHVYAEPIIKFAKTLGRIINYRKGRVQEREFPVILRYISGMNVGAIYGEREFNVKVERCKISDIRKVIK